MGRQHDLLLGLSSVRKSDSAMGVRVLVGTYGSREQMAERFLFGLRLVVVCQRTALWIERFAHKWHADVRRREFPHRSNSDLDGLKGCKYGLVKFAAHQI